MSKDEYLITDAPLKALTVFAMPMILGSFFQQIYNMADSIIVGQFVGSSALAAVGACAALTNVFICVALGAGVGAGVLVSRYFGAREYGKMKTIVSTSLISFLLLSIILGVFGFCFSHAMMSGLQTPADILKEAVLYLRVYFVGFPFLFMYNILSTMFTSIGESKIPLGLLIFSSILNIVLDIVLVIVFHMGVAGVSIATIFSQGVSAVLVTRALMRSDDLYQLEFQKIRFHKSALISLIWVGCPTGIQSILYSVTNMLIQTFLNNLGTDTVAAWSAFGKIDSLYWMVNNAFGIAVTTFVGQNFGAGKYDRMKKSVRIGLCMGLCTALALTLIFYNFGTPLFRLFTSDENVVSIGMQMLHHVAPAYCLFVFIELLSGALRGTGDVVIPMLITCFGVCLLRIAWLFFIVPLAPGLNTIVLSYPVTWAITAVMFIVYYCYRARKWPKSSAKKTA